MTTASPPTDLWPKLTQWHPVGMHDPVFRVVTSTGVTAYLRSDDGSGPLLHHLNAEGTMPVPVVLEARDGWLLLSALPGVPLSNPVWLARPVEAAAIAADALRRFDTAGVRHGDPCLPNILGDPETGQLSGVVDWCDANKYDREIDVAAVIWSCDFNGYDTDMALNVLRAYGWPVVTEAEVARLSAVWTALAGPPDAPASEVLR